MERLVVVVKTDKREEEKKIEDQMNDFNWVGSKHHY
jgi:hypothetical protein